MAFFFDHDFYPTPPHVIEQMIGGESLHDAVILEPSAGSGNIVRYAIEQGAKEVLACEIDARLRAILKTLPCKIIGEDFLKLESDKISHIDFIIMNPPFSADERHVLHAFRIAPPECRIIALCNSSTVKNSALGYRAELKALIDEYGSVEHIGSLFKEAERTTDVDVSVIRLTKPGTRGENDFSGFFLESDPEEAQYEGLMPYNVIRDIVNRYVEACRIFDTQLVQAEKMHQITEGFFRCEIGLSVSQGDTVMTRNSFRKEMQKSAWNFLFDKLDMHKYATRGLREDINKFVEKQHQIPFTMRNVYHMLDVVVGTHGSRMDRAIEEVFDKVTRHYDENRYAVEGWKTNSHYVLNQKFILGYLVERGWSGEPTLRYGHNEEIIEDLYKALCYMTGQQFNLSKNLRSSIREKRWGEWFEWTFFEVKCFKKGTIHFKFKDEDVWARFNQNVARIKGFPLPEAVRA